LDRCGDQPGQYLIKGLVAIGRYTYTGIFEALTPVYRESMENRKKNHFLFVFLPALQLGIII
jgi:hypothetical protein